MKQKFFSSLVCLLLPAWVCALGLGNLELKSGLNQPLDARIELLYATVEELQSLNIGLADADAFQRADIERPFMLSDLRFEIDSSGEGPAYILISSREAIREPFLNFLLEANWARGRLYREYTLLLDPPLYDPNARRAQVIDTIAADSGVYDGGDDDIGDDDIGDEMIGLDDAVPSLAQGAGDYGPTIANDTLWSIARQMRPDASVSIQQMMLALLRANPEAFLDNNINGLKRGEILRMPTPDELSLYSQSEALSETRLQYDLWQDARGIIASATTDRAERSGISESYDRLDAGTDDTVVALNDSAELRLVVAADGGTAAGQFDGESGGSGENLALVNEQLEALSQENAELRDRMAENDTIINDLERLIALKDDELAAMQQQLSGAMSAEDEYEDTELTADPETAAVEEVPADVEAAFDEANGLGAEPVASGEVAPGEAAPAMEAEDVPEADASVVEQEPVTVTEVAEEPPPAGILDQVIAFVVANMIMIAAVLGGLLLVIGLAVFLVKRKRNAADKVAVPIVGATDFSGFDDATADEILGIDGGDEAGEAEAGAAADEQAQPEAEEDPLTEVNVFLAYEQYEQAEEFVRDAISREPDNIEFHTKLLEVHYAAGNKQAYEEAARALNALVGLEGPQWEMAKAMWAELSPNRELFAEAVAGEDDAVAMGGIVDLTADAGEAAPAADDGLDFDLDMSGGTQTPAAPVMTSDESEDILDVTAAVGTAAPASDEAEDDMLDVTTAMSGGQGDSLLDVTAGVGLDMDFGSTEAPADSGTDDDMLDITGGGTDEGMLDITGGGADEDMLDITGGADEGGLLETAGEAAADEDDDALDFDIGGTEEPEAAGPEDEGLDVGDSDTDNVIDFDTALSESSGADDEGLEIGVGLADESSADESSADDGLDVDLSAVDDMGLELGGLEAEGDEISLDTGADSSDSADAGLEIDLTDAGDAGDDDFSLDIGMDDAGESDASADTASLSADEDDDLSIDLGMDSDDGVTTALEIGDEDDGAPDVDLYLDTDTDTDEPAIGLDENDEDDEDDDDMRTVFIPRSADENEQSADDEIATKLDLAKAYVELGDQDSAKSILDEVIAAGNDAQKQQAQDLLSTGLE